MVQRVSGQPNRLATLQALRDRLTESIDTTLDPVALSSLALRLQRTLAEIDDLGGDGVGRQRSAVDELTARRAARRNA